jgi:D-alanyl-D-alanine carboxypeptidase/D-alanyl-D-alanine-endopeptidase (penicillin-binding protein 4)
VVDAATGKTLFDRASTVVVPPASTAKLLTAAAALTVLGPDRRLVTSVVRVGNAVVLVGGGDPTLAGPRSVPHYPAAARLVDLAARTAAALGPAARVSVAVDDSLFTGPRTGLGWKPNYLPDGDVAPVSALELDGARLRPDDDPRTPDPRASDPALHAGRAFAALLRARGVTVVGSVVRERASTTGRELASVQSAPMSELVEGMLARSDNDLAEALTRHLAIAAKRPATFESGAAAIVDAVAALGIHGPRLHDGSGLSTLDRASPAQLAEVVLTAAGSKHPELRPIISGLPVAGFSGTLSKRFASAAPARGLVRAKTGTLTGVSTLAGEVLTADGRLLVFAATAPHAPGTKRAQLALDRLLAVLAGCGCR